MMANFEESRVLVGGNVVVIEKGQMILSQQNISEKWNISRQTLRTFLNHLEKDGMISRYFVQKTNHKITILTICNYSKYQDSSTTNQPLINHRATTEQPQSNQIKECKELKEGKEVRESVKINGHNFIPPTIDELENYTSEKGYDFNCTAFYQYYEAGDWRDKDGKKIKNWKQKVVSWWSRDGKKTKQQEPEWIRE